jgi:hypothetical protein
MQRALYDLFFLAHTYEPAELREQATTSPPAQKRRLIQLRPDMRAEYLPKQFYQPSALIKRSTLAPNA